MSAQIIAGGLSYSSQGRSIRKAGYGETVLVQGFWVVCGFSNKVDSPNIRRRVESKLCTSNKS